VTKEKQYKKWDDIKKRLDSINSMSQHEIIKEYNKDIQGKYLILDKKKGEMKLYQGNRELGTFEVLTGKNEGDKQTKTVIRDGKVYWEEGNKMTGAGTYIVSGVNPKNTHYSNAPTWNFKNEKGEEVPMAIHSAFGNRFSKLGDKNQENNRLSNGCINGNPKDLIKIYNNGYQLGSLLYVLPDNPDNKFQIINGKLLFRSKDPEVNRTVKSLNYIPIKVEIEKERFKKEVFQFLDLDDELEYNMSTKPFIEALEKGKKKVMKAAKIDGDVYNDLAKIAFGIYGTESNFGDTHTPYGNLVRAGKKVLNPSSSSSPDYVSKATLYMQNKDSNSVGPTQIRFNMLDQTEKNILKQLGITDNMQLLNSWYAALGTVGILASRYINQLTSEEKKDPMTNLPKKWNVRKNYPDRVKQNSKYVTIKELH